MLQETLETIFDILCVAFVILMFVIAIAIADHFTLEEEFPSRSEKTTCLLLAEMAGDCVSDRARSDDVNILLGSR